MKACLFAHDRLVLAEDALQLPSLKEVKAWGVGDAEWFPVDKQGQSLRSVAALAEAGWTPPQGVVAVGLRAVLSLLAQPEISLVLTAAHLARWRRTSRYCGVCGTATEPSRRHRARACPSCGHLAFPKISPAVIVQVTRGARILLGRSRRHPHGSHSVLTGFVDPGESLEEAARREVNEESGIRVRGIRYFGSQPWPFPDSLIPAAPPTVFRHSRPLTPMNKRRLTAVLTSVLAAACATGPAGPPPFDPVGTYDFAASMDGEDITGIMIIEATENGPPGNAQSEIQGSRLCSRDREPGRQRVRSGNLGRVVGVAAPFPGDSESRAGQRPVSARWMPRSPRWFRGLPGRTPGC